MAATGPCSPDTPKISSSSNGDSSAKAHAASTMMATDAAHANANEAHSTSNESAAAAAPPPHAVTDNSTIMPTYYSTKQSKAYTLANQLLKSGSFDDALATLEMALQFSREIVANLAGNNNHSDDNTTIDDDDIMNIEMHESLAPLYYLYGTTLLYSVEESDVMMTGNDNSGNPQQEDQQGGDGGDGAFGEEYFEVAPEDEEEEEDQLPEGAEDEEGDAAAAASSPPTAADAAEDMQIAWENLDLARSIVSRLVEKFPNSYHASVDDASTTGTIKIALKSNTPTNHPSKSTVNSDMDHHNYTPEQQTELLLDLAQIHTRLGDIQRSNDNLLSCIDDYQHALTLRLETLGKYHKKVADSHFSLAAIYAQAPNTMGENEGRVNMFVNSLGGGGGGMDSGEVGGGGGLTEEEKAQYRQRSLEHYLACGVAFSGMLAQICGMNPDEFTTINDASTTFESMGGGTASSSAGMEMAAASASAAGSTTTTPTSSMVYTEAMSILRQRIATLAQSSTSMAALSQDDREEFTNVQEMLDEIQEAMDSAKETEAGLKILSETKANEIKKHEMKVNGGDDEENGGGGFGVGGDGGITTTIGFHVPSTSMALTAASTTATSSAAETATAAGPTMMVVKKKKKQPLPQAGEEDLSYKRTKTN